MPHLSQLQRDYKDKQVTIIGMTSEDPGNSLEKVRAMVKSKSDVMAYTVAWDEGQETNEAYMKASNQRGIPTSFLVDQAGKIAWIGHPLSADIPLSMVVDGTWDYVKGPALLKSITDAKGAIYASVYEDPAQALELLTQFRADYPAADQGLDSVHFTILTQLPAQVDAATQLGQRLIAEATAAGSAADLNAIAWGLVDPEQELEHRFLDLALLAAAQANEFSGGKDPSILDTVARVHFWRGDLELALSTQKRAVEHAESRGKEALQKAVEEYERALESKRSS